MTRNAAFDLVWAARERAEKLRTEGKLLYTSASTDCPTEMWLAALVEELGEVARCIHEDNEEGLRHELADLAGVAIGRLEALTW